MIARHTRVRRKIINALTKHPAIFRALMAGAMQMIMSAV